MPYRIRTYSEYRNGQLGIQVPDDTIMEGAFSVDLVGNSHEGFSQTISEAILWTSTNFAGDVEPISPITGQLWFSTDSQSLRVYNGNSWDAVGSFIKPSLLTGTPKVLKTTDDITHSIGTFDKRHIHLYASAVYAESITIENPYDQNHQNITINSGGNSSIYTTDDRYSHTRTDGTDTTVMQEIIDLKASIGGNSDVQNRWTITDNTTYDATIRETSVLMKDFEHNIIDLSMASVYDRVSLVIGELADDSRATINYNVDTTNYNNFVNTYGKVYMHIRFNSYPESGANSPKELNIINSDLLSGNAYEAENNPNLDSILSTSPILAIPLLSNLGTVSISVMRTDESGTYDVFWSHA